MSWGITVLLGLATVVAIGLTVWWVRSPDQSPLNPSYLQHDSALRGMSPNYASEAKKADAAMAGGSEAAAKVAAHSSTDGRTEAAEPELLTEAEKARREIPIVMYVTSECPISGQARAYMKRMKYEFEERDIDTDAKALARAEKINPSLSTPTFEIGSEVLLGFGEKKLQEAIDRAVAAKDKKGRRPRRK